MSGANIFDLKCSRKDIVKTLASMTLVKDIESVLVITYLQNVSMRTQGSLSQVFQSTHYFSNVF